MGEGMQEQGLGACFWLWAPSQSLPVRHWFIHGCQLQQRHAGNIVAQFMMTAGTPLLSCLLPLPLLPACVTGGPRCAAAQLCAGKLCGVGRQRPHCAGAV